MQRRRHLRLKGYDYAQQGLYFITICIYDKQQRLFGDVRNGVMVLNNLGDISEKYWLEIPTHFPHVKLHDFVVMPNHIHGIIEIIDNVGPVGANNHSPVETDKTNGIVGANNHSPENDVHLEFRANNYSPLPNRPCGTSKTIGSVVCGFKIGVVKIAGYKIWQRNYYEHIIRNYESYLRITDYINDNPKNWEQDKFNT